MDGALIAIGAVDVHRIDVGGRGSAPNESRGCFHIQLEVFMGSVSSRPWRGRPRLQEEELVTALAVFAASRAPARAATSISSVDALEAV